MNGNLLGWFNTIVAIAKMEIIKTQQGYADWGEEDDSNVELIKELIKNQY